MAVKTAKKKSKDNTTNQIVGAGVGVAGGAAAGAAIGTAVVPGIGTAVGAAVGAVAGGVGGAVAGMYIDPTDEERYWSEHYTERPYYREGIAYDEYRPAYRYGVEAATRYPGKSFEEIEKRLSRQWPAYRSDQSHLGWTKARDAVRDAHERSLVLHEERLRIDKEPVQTGEVQVRKEVIRERQKIDVPVEREEVVITRKKVNGTARPSNIAPQSEEIRIPVRHEKVKVTKEAVVTEEVDVSRRKVKDVEHVDDTILREELRVNETGNARARQTRRN